MSDIFDSWIYCQQNECIRILKSLDENNLISVPKVVPSGDMDLLIHVKGVVTQENESSYIVKVDCPEDIRDQLVKISSIEVKVCTD